MSSKRIPTVANFRMVRSAVSRSDDARGAIALGSASLVLPLGSFVANVVFARTLGASGRGDLAAIIAALSVCEAVLSFGLPEVLARHISYGSLPTGAQRTLATAAIAASLIPGVLLCLYCHSRHFSWPVAGVAGFVVPVVTYTVLARGVLVGQRAYRRLTASLIFSGAVRVVAPVVLILVENPTENLALILVLGWTVAPALPIFASRPFAGPLASVRDAWQILRESLAIWPLYLAWQLNSRLDQLVLAVFVSAADLGRYAVCAGIAAVPGFLAHGPRDVVLARVAKSHNFSGVPRITLAILVIGAMCGALSAYFAAPLLAAVFGPEFRSTALVLGILLVATGFDIGGGLLTSCLIAVGRGRSATMCHLVGLSVTVVVLPIAVLLGGGITSAAAVTVAAHACAYFLCLLSIRRLSRSKGASP